jgi:hypothetical protein
MKELQKQLPATVNQRRTFLKNGALLIGNSIVPI